MSFDPRDPKWELVPLGERPANVMERNWKAFPLDKTKWQVLNGWKVVSAKIPSPVAYVPRTGADGRPTGPYGWIGWQGVIAADGRVYHYETGREMKR